VFLIPHRHRLKTSTKVSADAGSSAGATLSLVGIAALAPDQNSNIHVATYQNLTVITAAAIIAITGVTRIIYYNMG
jgi:hypothetical protein